MTGKIAGVPLILIILVLLIVLPLGLGQLKVLEEVKETQNLIIQTNAFLISPKLELTPTPIATPTAEPTLVPTVRVSRPNPVTPTVTP